MTEGTVVTLTIIFDNYPEDISWDIVDANGNTIFWGGNYGSYPAGSTLTEELCLPYGCYDFTIYDSYGDGLCCTYGNGSYHLVNNDGDVLASGGTFSTIESTNFCLSCGADCAGGTSCTPVELVHWDFRCLLFQFGRWLKS